MDEYKRLYEIYIEKTDPELKDIINPENGYTQIAIKVASDILEFGRTGYGDILKRQGNLLSCADAEDPIPKTIVGASNTPKLWIIFLAAIGGLIAGIVLLSAFSDLLHISNNKSDATNSLIGKIYLNNSPASVLHDNFEFDFVKFYDDYTFQGLRSYWSYNSQTSARTDSYQSYFGTYQINGNALEMNISNSSYAGVILDNGETIILGEECFINYSDGTYSDQFLSQFKQ